ncbi:unnamed protein product [Caretta caretta]
MQLSEAGSCCVPDSLFRRFLICRYGARSCFQGKTPIDFSGKGGIQHHGTQRRIILQPDPENSYITGKENDPRPLKLLGHTVSLARTTAGQITCLLILRDVEAEAANAEVVKGSPPLQVWRLWIQLLLHTEGGFANLWEQKEEDRRYIAYDLKVRVVGKRRLGNTFTGKLI